MSTAKGKAQLSAGLLAQVACLLEVSARKAGNVHRGRDFEDAHYLDFVLSAAAIAGPMDHAPEQGVGRTVLDAIAATRRLVATNTNLGIVLLLAPLAAVPGGVDLERGVQAVLAQTTREDARLVYEAIRLARPGGLGSVPEQDVAGEPTVPLVDAMRLASQRDLVARQYASSFADVLGLALPAVRAALAEPQPLELAIITGHLRLLAERPDTLIARKRGAREAAESSRRAAAVLVAGWPHGPAARAAFEDLDGWLRAPGHGRNPGATADLMAAALFAALRDGTIRLPRPAGEPGFGTLELPHC